MKKTLIALLTLAGLAQAATISLTPLSDSGNWNLGNDNTQKTTDPTLSNGTLTYSNGDWSRGYGVYTLTEAITLSNEADTLTVSFVINSTDANSLVTGTLISSDLAIAMGHGQYSATPQGIQHGTSTDTSGNWYNMQAASTGGVYVSNNTNVAGVFSASTPLTLKTEIVWDSEKDKFVANLYQGANETLMKTYDLGQSYTLEKLVFSLDGGYETTQTVSDVSVVANIVPEPATASLSLLGLAALMIRRRRA